MRRSVLSVLALLFLIACQPSNIKKQPASFGDSTDFPALYVIKEEVNLRAEPSTSGKKIGSLEDGTILQVSENKYGWYQVRTDEGKLGWLRSDLAGPRELSLTRMASAFNDSIMPAYSAELFFDKDDLFKIIYLKLENSFYDSPAKAKEKAKIIVEAYQQKVYPGKVEARVMHPRTEELFTRVTMPAKGLANVPIPILDYGRLFSLKEQNSAVTLRIAVPDSIPNPKLLKAARRISARYDYPFKRTEIGRAHV